MVSGTRALPKLVVVEVEGEQGSGPEGVDDLCFHTYGGFSPPPPSSHSPLSLPPQIPVSKPKFQSRGPNPSLKAQIPAQNASTKASIQALRPQSKLLEGGENSSYV